MINIKEEELIKLNQQGLNSREIAEYFAKQGKPISSVAVNKRLRKYYQSHAIQRPKTVRKPRINIPIEEMVRLKEEEKMSDKKISEYFTSRGQPICELTVFKRLQAYYASQGKKKPIVTKEIDLPIEKIINMVEQGYTYLEITKQISTPNRPVSDTTVYQRVKQYYDAQGKQVPTLTQKMDVSTKKMIELKEQGLSDRQIAQMLTTDGKKISRSAVCTRLRKFYQSQGKEKPTTFQNQDQFIRDEEAVKVKEMGLTNQEVAQYFTEHGRPISSTSIGKKVNRYYQLHGKQKPPVKRKIRITIPVEELVQKKEEGFTGQEVATFFTKQGQPISTASVNKRIREYYQLQGKNSPERNYNQYSKREQIRKTNIIAQILLGGMTIREYIQSAHQQRNEEKISNKFQRLRFVAEHVEKVQDQWVADNDFIEVLDFVESQVPQDLENKYLVNQEPMQEKSLEYLKNHVFHGNEDVMTYFLLRQKAEQLDEPNQQIWQKLKRKYKEKVGNYLVKLHYFEEKSRENRMHVDKKKEENHLFGEESR